MLHVICILSKSKDTDFEGVAIPVWIRIPPHPMHGCIIDW